MPNDLTVFEFDSEEETPLPFLVADKWDFPLQAHETEEGFVYAIQDWIAGITTNSNITQASKLWHDIQRRNELSVSNRQLPYVASNGKTYQVDFADDKGLYIIAQSLRSSKNRPSLAEVKEFLANAGAFADAMRIDPSIGANAAISGFVRQGKSEAWVSDRLGGMLDRKAFTDSLREALMEVFREKGWVYGKATNIVYKEMLEYDADGIRDVLSLSKRSNIRNHLPHGALLALRLAETFCADHFAEHSEITPDEAFKITQAVCRPLAISVREVQQMMGKTILGIPLLTEETD